MESFDRFASEISILKKKLILYLQLTWLHMMQNRASRVELLWMFKFRVCSNLVSASTLLIFFRASGIDTVGDIRIPAAYCGILGFRSSQGAISSIGVTPVASSLDAVGKHISSCKVTEVLCPTMNDEHISGERKILGQSGLCMLQI